MGQRKNKGHLGHRAPATDAQYRGTGSRACTALHFTHLTFPLYLEGILFPFLFHAECIFLIFLGKGMGWRDESRRRAVWSRKAWRDVMWNRMAAARSYAPKPTAQAAHTTHCWIALYEQAISSFQRNILSSVIVAVAKISRRVYPTNDGSIHITCDWMTV